MDLEKYLKNDHKVYVEVIVRYREDGTILPMYFTWEDNTQYQIDRIIDVRPAASLKAGGTGLRYTVRIGKKQTFMWLEEDGEVFRWFMERK